MPASSDWQIAIDLVANPSALQPTWGFDAIFLIGIVILGGLSVLSWRFRWRRRRSLAIFSVVWIAGVVVGIVYDVHHAYAARAQVRAGEYRTMEGCLEYFHPGVGSGSRYSGPVESWEVGGVAFEYSGGQAGFFYHTIESRGGAVHATSRVRVSFIRNASYSRNEIVRLLVKPNACPAAPDRS